jgi:putative DNA primase/helicase
MSWGVSDNSLEHNPLENHIIEIAPAEASAGPEPELALDLVGTGKDSGPAIAESINFDSSLEAALFYARDDWHVVPICNFDRQAGRCTASWHKPDKRGNPCTGKKPLVAGLKNAKPGDGYTAATTDLSQIRRWFATEFPDAGVGIRLDGHALIDCDLKDGGPESYEYLRDTFLLPDTLTAITQSGGRHYVFKLPEDLPAKWLRSWGRVTREAGLDGIDLKIDVCGLLYAEPTIGSKGVYRWIDPTTPPATLPREACDYLHEVYLRDDRKPAQKSKAARPAPAIAASGPRQFDHDQAKYFRDVGPGESRHRRLFEIACSIRANTRATAYQIADALRYHASRFSNPLDDEAYIQRIARQVEAQY